MEAELLQYLSSGGDLSTILILIYMVKLDRRVVTLEVHHAAEKVTG